MMSKHRISTTVFAVEHRRSWSVGTGWCVCVCVCVLGAGSKCSVVYIALISVEYEKVRGCTKVHKIIVAHVKMRSLAGSFSDKL